MIGQKRLLNVINNYTIKTFPKTLLLIGEKGCGKHTLANYISTEVLKIPTIDITDILSDATFDEIYRKAVPNIYLVDLNKCTEVQQNLLLKITEEPPSNSFLILFTESANNLLNTLLNRCVRLSFDKYSAEELRSFADNSITAEYDMLITEVLRTPGRVIYTDFSTLVRMMNECKRLIEDMPHMSFYEAIATSNKVNFKDQYDKFDFDIFLNLLEYLLYNRVLQYADIKASVMYNTLKKRKKYLIDARINRGLFFEGLMIDLWKDTRWTSKN